MIDELSADSQASSVYLKHSLVLKQIVGALHIGVQKNRNYDFKVSTIRFIQLREGQLILCQLVVDIRVARSVVQVEAV